MVSHQYKNTATERMAHIVCRMGRTKTIKWKKNPMAKWARGNTQHSCTHTQTQIPRHKFTVIACCKQDAFFFRNIKEWKWWKRPFQWTQEMNEAPEHYTIIAPNLMETKQKSNNFIILSASFYRAYFLLPSPVTISCFHSRCAYRKWLKLKWWKRRKKTWEWTRL